MGREEAILASAVQTTGAESTGWASAKQMKDTYSWTNHRNGDLSMCNAKSLSLVSLANGKRDYTLELEKITACKFTFFCFSPKQVSKHSMFILKALTKDLAPRHYGNFTHDCSVQHDCAHELFTNAPLCLHFLLAQVKTFGHRKLYPFCAFSKGDL